MNATARVTPFPQTQQQEADVPRSRLEDILENILETLLVIDGKLDKNEERVLELGDNVVELTNKVEDLEFRTEYPGSSQDE